MGHAVMSNSHRDPVRGCTSWRTYLKNRNFMKAQTGSVDPFITVL